MGLKEFFSLDGYIGKKREYAELQFEKEEIEYGIANKAHGWEATFERLDEVNERLRNFKFS
jgi:hypothetical protein